MKAKHYAWTGAAMLFFFTAQQAITNSNGAPQGRTGSPASSGQTCNSGGCHSGPANSGESVTISTDIPSSGFEEQDDYQITVTGDDGGRNLTKMGFQASVESGAGHEGSLSSTSGNTQIVGNYITHTGSGTSAGGGQKSWSFDWNSATAPDQTTIYAAVNFTNNNGLNSGDVVVTNSLTLTKDPTMNLEQRNLPRLEIFPNPAHSRLTLATERPVTGPLRITDLRGRLIHKVASSARDDAHHWTISVEELAAGTYLLKTPQGATGVFRKQ